MKVCMCKNCHRQYIVKSIDENDIIDCKCGNKIDIKTKSIDITEDYLINEIKEINQINKLEGLQHYVLPLPDFTYVLLITCYPIWDNINILKQFCDEFKILNDYTYDNSLIILNKICDVTDFSVGTDNGIYIVSNELLRLCIDKGVI